MLSQLDTILCDLLGQPDGDGLSAFDDHSSLLSMSEPSIPEFNSGDIKLLHHFVEHQALQNPEKVALEFVSSFHPNGNPVSTSWTYRELDFEANKVANLLLSRGIKVGDVVGVFFEKSAAASFAIVGILKAGATFMGLDTNAPIARTSFILSDSRAAAVLSHDKHLILLQKELKVPTLNIAEAQEYPGHSPTLAKIPSQDESCYCIYTSGTTGTPKGVIISHESAVQCMFMFQKIFTGRWSQESRWYQFALYAWDVSVLEQFWPWSVGVSVVSSPRDVLFEDLPGVLKRLKITHLDLTPSLARLLHPNDVPTLCDGVFIVGGDVIKPELINSWGSELGKGCLHNFYGPSEATIGVTVEPVTTKTRATIIGKAFDNVGVYVLHPKTEIPVPRGAIGELCVSGKMVGKGYIGRDDLTKERFATLKKWQERVYRTGDLVRMLHDGRFEFLGRADDQIKLRGQRLEIGEINSVIKSVKNVVDVATLVLCHNKQQKEQLVAFVVLQEDNDPSSTTGKSADFHKSGATVTEKPNLKLIEDIRASCQGKLPVYMVPTHIIPLTKIPLSANNKVDAKALGGLYTSLSLEDLQHLSFRDSTDEDLTSEEVRICDILTQTTSTNVKDLKKHSNIFELGLDSISIIGFAQELRTAGFKNAQISVIMQSMCD